jgi:cytosine/adenosine deaminase-related metal-dependent hydrolase
MEESPIFTRTYDLLRWLIPATLKFPRQQRFVLAEAVQQSALRFQEQIIAAGHSRQPRPVLEQADVTLAQLRAQIRLCHDLGLFSKSQYWHVAGMVNEVGKLLGGWLKTV